MVHALDNVSDSVEISNEDHEIQVNFVAYVTVFNLNILTSCQNSQYWLGYKTFFTLNSTEHEISLVHKNTNS